MTVYLYDDKRCPKCKKQAIVLGKDRKWRCLPKRGGCGARFAAGAVAIVMQAHTTYRYRKQFKLPDGTTTRICGTPAINTAAAAEQAERDRVEREQLAARQRMKEAASAIAHDLANEVDAIVRVHRKRRRRRA